MSDTPSTGISRATVLFIVLLLALGALVLASNSISSQSMIRPGEVEFVPWTSPDGHITLRHPIGWEAQAVQTGMPAFAYEFWSRERSTAEPDERMRIMIVRDTRSAEQQLESEISSYSPEIQQTKTTRPITIGKYPGTATYLRFPGSGRPGQPARDAEIWILRLGDKYSIRIDMVSLDFKKMQPLFERMWQSMEFDEDALIAALDALSTVGDSQANEGAAPPASTAEPTAEPAMEPTAAATAS